MIWLAIHLPHLPVESIAAASSSPEGKRQLLEAVAACALIFTPRVSLAGERDIVLELSASLRLFGGLEAMVVQLRDRIAALGLTVCLAEAPQARAALWLAGWPSGMPDAATDGLPGRPWRAALLALPLEALLRDGSLIDVRALEGLARIGAHTVADLERLPRAGLARRFGTHLLDRLDEAFGRRAMAMAFHEPPTRLVLRVELDHDLGEVARLLAVVQRLFVQVEAFLRARSGATECIDVDLHHDNRPATRVRIETGRAQCSATEFALLARERFARLVLCEPVCLIEVRVDTVCAQDEVPTSLFPDEADRARDLERLVDRLQARLGAAAVQGLLFADDHRPERASIARPWRDRPIRAGMMAGVPVGQRPVWLLGLPQPIRESEARLYLDRASGFDHRLPIELLGGPERIEAGWWDGDEAARDYFLARSADAALLWIYRTRSLAARWFLHGIFA